MKDYTNAGGLEVPTSVIMTTIILLMLYLVFLLLFSKKDK